MNLRFNFELKNSELSCITIVLKGKVKVNPESDSLEETPYHTLVLSGEKNESGVAIQATEDDTEIVLVRHLSGPYMTNPTNDTLLADCWRAA